MQDEYVYAQRTTADMVVSIANATPPTSSRIENSAVIQQTRKLCVHIEDMSMYIILCIYMYICIYTVCIYRRYMYVDFQQNEKLRFLSFRSFPFCWMSSTAFLPCGRNSNGNFGAI